MIWDAALEAYAGKSVADVKSANAPGSVDAATKDGTLYAFPMSADNGYFLYYNSELVTPEDAQSWDTLLAAAEKAGKKVGMTFASGWYNASFFYGAGFTTALNDDGSTAMDWNGTSADGGYRCTGLYRLCWVSPATAHSFQSLMVMFLTRSLPANCVQ